MSYGCEQTPLFMSTAGHAARQHQIDSASGAADGLDEAVLRAKSDEEIILDMQKQFEVCVPVLDTSNVGFKKHERTVRRENHWGETVSFPMTSYEFYVSFRGDQEVLRIRPNHFDTNPPYADVSRGNLRITVNGQEDAAKIKAEYENVLGSIQQYLNWHREMWKGLDTEIARVVAQRLLQRRQRLARTDEASDSLSAMGFKPQP